MLKKISYFTISLLIILFLIYFYWNYKTDKIQLLIEKNKPFGLRFAIINDTNKDKLEFISQLIIYPKYKRIILYSLHTDATVKDKNLIKDLSPSSADFFEEFTEISNNNYIHLTKSNAEHLIDLFEGINFYIEDNVFLKDSLYQYPRGFHYFSGEQVMEYFTLQKIKESLTKEYSIIDKLYRQESILLNIFWQRSQIENKISNIKLYEFAKNLTKTNLSLEELSSIMKFIINPETHLQTLEVPLDLKNKNSKQIIEIKKDRASIQYKEYIARSEIKWVKPQIDDYSIQILNGTETSGLAKVIRESIQNLGPNILDVDNYKYKPLSNTMIIERSGNTYIAQKMMKLLNLNKDENRISFNRKASDIEISLLIGKDFSAKKLKLN